MVRFIQIVERKRKGRNKNMTNAQIIFNEAVELMKNGKIGKTGRQFEVEDENGNKIMLDEPEDIHTFQAWKKLQFSSICNSKKQRRNRNGII